MKGGAEAEVSAAGPDRRQLLEALADELRPQLHRYAARLVGSVIDGEDVVQDTYARAFAALDGLPAETPLRPWLLRIAHNRAIDLMRRDRLRPSQPIETETGLADEEAPDPEDAVLRREAVGLAVSRFAALPVPQRAAVILKDVLDESIADIAVLLDLSIDAVKANLARGRMRLRTLPPPTAPGPRHSEQALRFAALFNRQDWTSLRALLADDVRLYQARRPPRRGSDDVGMFFTFYAGYAPVRLEPVWLDGREVHLVFEAADASPQYFMLVSWADDRIAEIRDHRYARYVIEGADVTSL